jgi:hypothetical protein
MRPESSGRLLVPASWLNKLPPILVFLIAVIVHLLVIGGQFWEESYPEGSSDEARYVLYAQQIRAGEGMHIDGYPDIPTAYVMPTIPLMFAVADPDSLVRLRLVQLAISGLVAVLTFFLGRRLFRSDTVGWLAVFFLLANFGWVMQPAFLLTEPLFTLLLTLAVTCIVIDPRGWKTLSAAGVLLGLDWLTRGALIGPLLLIFPYLWYRAGFRKMLLTGVMMGLVISPWVIRNYFAFDTLLATSTQSGNVFAGAYNDIVYEDPWADGWINPDQLYLDDVSPETALDEVAYSNYQVQQGRQWILDNPLKVPKLLAAHTLGFIRPWPYITRNDAELVYELLSWGVGVMLLSYGTWMAFRQRNEAILVMLIVILGAFLAGIALYAIPRFRLPFAPMFAVIEAGAVWWLWAAWQVRRTKPDADG